MKYNRVNVIGFIESAVSPMFRGFAVFLYLAPKTENIPDSII